MCLGIPGEVVALHEDHGLRFAEVRFGGVTRQVCLECQVDAAVGDFVLVHVGFAIARIDREEAERAWSALHAMGGLDDLEPFDPPDPPESPTEAS
ncbi:MAG TPA: HypC/HybG/HupF family hydrogenase formation chaperone [Polyangia bacterium]|jgi:hydrogenase expression/formation protein HypC